MTRSGVDSGGRDFFETIDVRFEFTEDGELRIANDGITYLSAQETESLFVWLKEMVEYPF